VTAIDMISVDHPHMSLVHFADSDEQEAVLGPLFATAAKADVAVFGPDKFTTSENKKKMVNEIKIAIHSREDPVAELLAGPESNTDATTSDDDRDKTLGASMSILGLAKSKKDKSSITQNNVLDDTRLANSGRETHQKVQNSMVSLAPTVKAQGNTRDNIMLRRAINGYLFDCAKNITLLKNDEWLQGAWLWVKSILKISCFDLVL
jgi:hypothetical protein